MWLISVTAVEYDWYGDQSGAAGRCSFRCADVLFCLGKVKLKG